jgi:hypothetical protein
MTPKEMHMKTMKPVTFRFPRFERALETALFAATTVVVTGGVVAVFVRLGFGLA